MKGGAAHPPYSMECFFHDNRRPWFVAILHLSSPACRTLLHQSVFGPFESTADVGLKMLEPTGH